MISRQELAFIVETALLPGRFVVLPPLELEWFGPVDETTHWELFFGHALDQTQTREQQRFVTWGIRIPGVMEPSDEPLISIKWDGEVNHLHVCRAIQTYVHRAIGNFEKSIETIETERWVRELVATIDFTNLAGEAIEEELAIAVEQAVVGTSRLPLTSRETPMPAFSLGWLGYRRVKTPQTVVRLRDLAMHVDEPRMLELFLRADPSRPLNELLCQATDIPDGKLLIRNLKTIYLGAALTPYTSFVPRTVELLQYALKREIASGLEVAQFMAWLIRLLARHLGVYELSLYHHRGANYPDALLLEEMTKALTQLLTVSPSLADSAEIRQAVLMSWVLRESHRNLSVPDQPTSPGENIRVLPSPFQRVPDEQISEPKTRTRRLFTTAMPNSAIIDETTSRAVADLADADVFRELGTVVVLDRPFGRTKQPGEPDATPLLAWEAYSQSLATTRLGLLQTKFPGSPRTAVAVKGIPIVPLARTPRPGVVSIEDALRIAGDFVLVRSTPSSLKLLRHLVPDLSGQLQLVVPITEQGREILLGFDATYQTVFELTWDESAGFESRKGVELPVGGVKVIRRRS